MSVTARPLPDSRRAFPLPLLTRLTGRPVALLSLWSLWLSLEYVLLGPRSFVRIHDTGDAFIPRYLAAAEEFWKSGAAHWLPWMGAGVDRLSQDLQYTHPAEALFLLFPGWAAYQLFMVGTFFIAGIGAFALARKHLNLDTIAATLAGLAFPTFIGSGHYLCLQFGISGLPLVLLLQDRAGRRGGEPSARRNRWQGVLAWIGAAAVYGLVSSLPWTLPFAAGTSFLWFSLVRRRTEPAFWAAWVGFFAVAGLTQVDAALALVLNSADSHRTAWSPAFGWDAIVTAFHLEGRRWIVGLALLVAGGTTIAAGRIGRGAWRAGLLVASAGAIGLAFIGIDESDRVFQFAFMLLVVLQGVRFGQFRDRGSRSVLATWLVLMALMPVLDLARLAGGARMGILGGFQWIRFNEFLPLFAGLGAALAIVPALRGDMRDQRGFPAPGWVVTGAFGFVLAFSLMLKTGNIRDWSRQGGYAVNYANPVLRQLGREIAGRAERAAVISSRTSSGYELHPAFANAYGIETLGGYLNVYPRRLQQFWWQVIEPAARIDTTLRPYFLQWGSRAYLFNPETAPVVEPTRLFRPSLLAFANVRYLISDRPVAGGPYRLHAADSTGDGPGGWRRSLGSRRNMFVYEDTAALPRFFVASRLREFQSEADLFAALRGADLVTLRSTVFAERGVVDASGVVESFTAEPPVPHDVVYGRDEIRLSVDLGSPGFLVGTNSFSRFWRCRVNGVDQPIWPAYAAFWGVRLEAGRNDVVFSYEPPY